MDVGAGAAGAFRLNGDPVVIELERDPHHIIALLMQQRGSNGRSTPPDMATTTRVSDGGLARPSS